MVSRLKWSVLVDIRAYIMIETANSYTDGVGICSSEFPTSNIISQPQLVSVSVSSLLINQNIELWGVGFHLAMGNAISLLQIVVFNVYTQALSAKVALLYLSEYMVYWFSACSAIANQIRHWGTVYCSCRCSFYLYLFCEWAWNAVCFAVDTCVERPFILNEIYSAIISVLGYGALWCTFSLPLLSNQ